MRPEGNPVIHNPVIHTAVGRPEGNPVIAKTEG